MALRKIYLKVGNIPMGQAITRSHPYDDGNIYKIPTYPLTVSGKNNRGARQSKRFEVIRFGIVRKSEACAPSIIGLADAQTYDIKMWLPDYRVYRDCSSEHGAWLVYGNFLIHDGPDKPMKQTYISAGCIGICGFKGFMKFNEFIINLSGSTVLTRTGKLNQIGISRIMRITYMKAERPPYRTFAS